MLQFRPIVCAMSSQRSPRPLPYKLFNISTVAQRPTTLEAGIWKVGGKIRISGRIKTLGSKSDFTVKIDFLACFFNNINYI